jgi:hypothetical protein
LEKYQFPLLLLFFVVISCVPLSKFLNNFCLRETSDAQTTSGWKPYGTPLVSSISCDDVITRGDIQLLVHKMVSPIARTESLGQSNISDTNISIAASDQCRDLSSGEACTDSSTLLRLPLQLVDESNACIDLSVGEDKPIRLSSSSTSILVYVDWSQKLLYKYDTHYLENLPEVFNGPPNKKARTEPLSLYTCLEAFLREEPLVPEDMWLVSSSSTFLLSLSSLLCACIC